MIPYKRFLIGTVVALAGIGISATHVLLFVILSGPVVGAGIAFMLEDCVLLIKNRNSTEATA